VILFRRGREQMRARKEEIASAEEEGVRFEFLTAPVTIEGDAAGVVRRIHCIRMSLGSKDDSGRLTPIPVQGSEFCVDADTVIVAIGQGPNPTVQRATPTLATKDGMVEISSTGQTSLPDVYAGGDIVRGGSTVVEAMRDGRAAATAIDEVLRKRRSPNGWCPGQKSIPFRIVERSELAAGIVSLEVKAPEIARHWQPGQFVVLRPTSTSERIPLTIVDGDGLGGTVRLILQIVGKTTRVLASLQCGEAVEDILGPLGKPAFVGKAGRVWCIGGGVGVAEVFPVARMLKRLGNEVVVLAGARSADRQILTEELKGAAQEVHWATNDGSAGFHGTVVDLMRDLRMRGHLLPAFVHVIGPVPLMRAAADLTREWGIPTVASLNPIMLDGTGMCGGCRVSVGGHPRFACVDGPEFDAHLVDFDQLESRNAAYAHQEQIANQCHARLG
jgi:ferredoxin/flavodoxin---NADP+ reductase